MWIVTAFGKFTQGYTNYFQFKGWSSRSHFAKCPMIRDKHFHYFHTTFASTQIAECSGQMDAFSDNFLTDKNLKGWSEFDELEVTKTTGKIDW